MARKIWAYRKKSVWRHRGTRSGVAHKRIGKWKVPDRGRLGHTPKQLQWSRKAKFKHIPGYKIDLATKQRLAALRKFRKRHGKLSTARTLQGIININPGRKSDKIMKKDLKKIYPGWGKK